MISDPDTAIAIIKKMGLQIVGDDDGSVFDVYLPDGTAIRLKGFRSIGLKPMFATEGTLDGRCKAFGIAVSRFNDL